MCVICVKPAGANFPSKNQFKTMYRRNPDGAGFMFLRAGADAVEIRKGFMSYSAFRNALSAEKLSAADTVIFHFRIATHGGINRGMCQPFPLSNKKSALTATSYKTAAGVAHNGIISMCNDARKLSDTALFIAQYMTRLCPENKPDKRRFDDITLNIIEACIGSKMAILTSSGDVHILGRGWVTEGDLIFSNDSYIPIAKKKNSTKYYAPYSWQDEIYTDYSDATYCDGYCSLCKFQNQCWDIVADTDRGINSI